MARRPPRAKVDEHREALQRAAAERAVVRVTREELVGDHVHGIPLDVGELDIGENLVLLQQVDDWQLAGWHIVRLRDITAVRRGPYEAFKDRVLAGEGQRDRIGPPSPEVPITSWRTVFEALRDERRLVIVRLGEDEDAPLYLGPVREVEHDLVRLRYVSALGVADDDLTEIRFVDVTSVEFDDPYSVILARHVQWEK